jgi:hypothetical protein
MAIVTGDKELLRMDLDGLLDKDDHSKNAVLSAYFLSSSPKIGSCQIAPKWIFQGQMTSFATNSLN